MRAIAFNISVPMTSWAVCGNSIVPTQTVPAWSAIVGMMGAALGIPRGSDALPRLASDYALAVRVERPGIVEADYHTIQTPNRDKATNGRPATRAQELALGSIKTTITRREYVQDAAYRIFVVQMDERPLFTVESIVQSLANPVYPLSAGRRSCIIGSIHAQMVDEAGVLTATHWDQRILLNKPVLMVKERMDQLVGNRKFAIRFECIA
jgi:CRISPR system Cascade subunit CasD